MREFPSRAVSLSVNEQTVAHRLENDGASQTFSDVEQLVTVDPYAGAYEDAKKKAAVAQAGTWQIDPNHSAAQFSVRHLGVSTVRGAFMKVSGSATYDPADPSKNTVDVSIDATSVDTHQTDGSFSFTVAP